MLLLAVLCSAFVVGLLPSVAAGCLVNIEKPIAAQHDSRLSQNITKKKLGFVRAQCRSGQSNEASNLGINVG